MATRDLLASVFHGMERGIERFDQAAAGLAVDVERAGARVGRALGAVLDHTGIAGAMQHLTGALDARGLHQALERTGAAIGTAVAPLLRLGQAATGVARSLGSVASGVAARAVGAVGAFTSAPTAATRKAQDSAFAGAQAVVGQATGRAAGDLTGVFGNLAGAANGLVGALSGIPGQLAQFVGAFSPATMEAFSRAMGDLMAVLGSALEPIVTAFTQLTREVADQLLPVMEQLRPIISQMAGEFLARMIPVVQLFARILIDLMPVFKLFADLMSALTPLIQASMAVFGAMAQAIASFLGGLFGSDGAKSAMDGLKKAIFDIAKAFVLFAAYMAKLFGATTFLDALKKGLGEPDPNKRDSTGMRAAQNAQYSSFLEYGRQVALAASTARGGKKPETTEDIWKDIRGQIAKIMAEGGSLKDLLLKELPAAIAKALVGDPTADKQTYTNKGARRITQGLFGGLGGFDFVDLFELGKKLDI